MNKGVNGLIGIGEFNDFVRKLKDKGKVKVNRNGKINNNKNKYS
jgi:hypothetical protein